MAGERQLLLILVTALLLSVDAGALQKKKSVLRAVLPQNVGAVQTAATCIVDNQAVQSKKLKMVYAAVARSQD